LARIETALNQDCQKIEKASTSSTGEHHPMGTPTNWPSNTSSDHSQQDALGSLSPMERFAKLSPEYDPAPWETKNILNELGFRESCHQDLDSMLNQAAVTAVSVLQRAGGISIVAAPGSI